LVRKEDFFEKNTQIRSSFSPKSLYFAKKVLFFDEKIKKITQQPRNNLMYFEDKTISVDTKYAASGVVVRVHV